MKFKTNKEKGNSSLGIAIAYFSTNGYTVSIPLNDTQSMTIWLLRKVSKFIAYKLNQTNRLQNKVWKLSSSIKKLWRN